MSIVHLQGKKTIMDIAAQIGQMERQFGIDTSVEDYVKELNFGLVEVVYEWANEMVRICRCMTHSMRLLLDVQSNGLMQKVLVRVYIMQHCIANDIFSLVSVLCVLMILIFSFIGIC